MEDRDPPPHPEGVSPWRHRKTTLRLLEEAGLPAERELPYEGAKPLLLADVDRRELLCRMVETVAAELPLPKKKRT